jgi:hypothetical protein
VVCHDKKEFLIYNRNSQVAEVFTFGRAKVRRTINLSNVFAEMWLGRQLSHLH